MHTEVLWVKLKTKRHLKDLSVGRKIKIKWIVNHLYMRVWTGMGWISLAQDGDKWLALVNVFKKKIVFHYIWNFLTRQELSANQKGLCLTENNLLRNLRMKYNASTPHLCDVPTCRRQEHTDCSMLGAFTMNKKRKFRHSGQLVNTACEINNEDKDTSHCSMVLNPLTRSTSLFCCS